MARFREIYKKEIVPALTKQFGYKSVMEVPRVSKVVLNMGVGEAVGDKKLLENAAADMQKIAGQKPVVTKARKAIADKLAAMTPPPPAAAADRQYRLLDDAIAQVEATYAPLPTTTAETGFGVCCGSGIVA